MRKLNRKQFIQSHGATCSNWNWSWSFVNLMEKFVIFGEWDIHTKGNISLILSKDWHIRRGRKQSGYDQAIQHISLIEKKGYKLKTFLMKHSDAHKDGPAIIADFTRKLTLKNLKRVGNNWYASDNEISNLIPEEVESPEEYFEGASKKVFVNTYERNPEARKKCLKFNGYICAICSFDFEKFYGAIGEKYIHVHHKKSISEIKKEYKLDPINDLVPVCPNCHAIIHRTFPLLTTEQLKEHLDKKR